MALEIWAELGSLWDGNPALAYRMIHEAALAGADVVKVQFGHDPADPVRGASDRHAEFLRDAVHAHGMKFAASFFSYSGLATGRRVGLDYYKIPSQKTYSDPALVEEVLSDHVPTYVSHGMATDGKGLLLRDNVYNVWCLSEYPTYPARLALMPKAFGAYRGYSDHVHGIGACLLAIARGAQMVEVHFTLNPANQAIRDHAFAKTPHELATMAQTGRDLARIAEAAR